MKTLWKSAVVAAGICLIGILMTATGCGKKRPPLPPLKDTPVLAAPQSLAYTLSGRDLTLTWTWRKDPDQANLVPEAFEVSMAVKDPKGCQGCPFVFEPVARVAVPDPPAYHQTLAPGYDYYFRVQALGRDQVKSAYSDTLYIDLAP
jgi:hypothetical protein